VTNQTKAVIPAVQSSDITIQDVEEISRKIELLESAEIKCLSRGLIWMSGMWNRKVMALLDKRDSMMVAVLCNA
jgi:hypothetical protein